MSYLAMLNSCGRSAGPLTRQSEEHELIQQIQNASPTPSASEPPTNEPASRVGRKITLNFHRVSAAAVRQISAQTLPSGGFVLVTAKLKDEIGDADVHIGDIMPDGTVYAGVSPDTGKPMYTTPADAPNVMVWQEAMDYAAKLGAHGHRDWRLPTKDELNLFFNKRAAIGGFNVSGSNVAGWYWSGTQNNKWYAWDQCFSDGTQANGYKSLHSSVRCVRW